MLPSVTRATVVIFLYILPGAIVLKCFRSEYLARPLIRVYTLVPFFWSCCSVCIRQAAVERRPPSTEVSVFELACMSSCF